LSEPEQFSPVTYDLSEAALKELYRDLDADRAENVTKLIDEAEELIESSLQKKPDRSKNPPPDKPAGERPVALDGPKVEPAPTLDSKPARQQKTRDRDPSRSKMGWKIAAALVALALLAVAAGVIRHWPAPTPRVARAAQPAPAVTGFLHVADLAAGRKINPGEVYAVDIPADTAHLEVVSGAVALVARNGATLRSCSNESFVVEIKHGSPGSAGPLVSSCGKEPAVVRAAIPPPPLPAPVPTVSVSPSAAERPSGD